MGYTKKASLLLGVLIILALTTGSLFAETVEVNSWLKTDTATIPYMTFDEDVEADPVGSLMENSPVDPFEYWPSVGTKIQITQFSELVFGEGSLNFELPELGNDDVKVALAATYINVPIWQKGTLKVTSKAPFSLYVDGESATSRDGADKEAEEETHEVTFVQGHHRLLIVTALSGQDSLDSWDITVSYEQSEDVDEGFVPSIVTTPKHRFDIEDYHLQEGISALKLSNNGLWLAGEFSLKDRKHDKKDYRFEIWDVKKKKMIWNYRGPKGVGIFEWAPDDSKLLVTFSGDDGTDLYFWDLSKKQFIPQEIGIEDASGFTWAPDGKGLYYYKDVEYEESEEPYKVMWSANDRWGGYRDKNEIWYYGFNGGTEVKVTSGRWDPETFDISADGKTMIALRNVEDVERPFSRYEFWKINLMSGESNILFTGRYQSLGYIRLSPDGTRVIYSAPRLEVTGNDNQNEDINYYDRDLYLLDTNTGETKNITPDFEPAVGIGYYGTGKSNNGEGAKWIGNDKFVFNAAYNKKILYCTYDFKTSKVTTKQLETGGISNLNVSDDGKTVVYRGDKVGDRPNVRWYDTKRKRGGVLIEMNKLFHELTGPLPKVVDYDYVNAEGVTIYGYLCYPADYDESKSYPLIVDTYGGVIGYGDGWIWGSYTYANRGYFCYIPVPRGAAGYGQEYADTHPNDWGEITSRDMNRGVRDIVANVSGVNGEKVGFVSGSYGGFLAMYLLAIPEDHPDYYPYATTISDYGISNLASYWGVGNWGYLYSDMASAGSYPWNRPDFYVKWSPLFHADKINAPLLLLHGDADSNVPVMESDQMYTALRVLGKEVAFVRFPGENHGIGGSYLVSKTMHLEWFDKYLRNQPGAWEERVEEEKK
jgi:dipeptidyl aminopeptidase/acylaminoacyl peptidase